MPRQRPRQIEPSSQPPPPGARKAANLAANRARGETLLDGGAICRVDGPTDAQIVAIAAAQRGRVSRRQLVFAGVGPDAIDRRVRTEALIRLHAGVYALPGTEDVPFGRETAALLACRLEAMLSHWSAAYVCELIEHPPDEVHIITPTPHRTGRPAGARLHRSILLEPPDRTVARGLPLTSPARIALDLAGTDTSPARIERLLSEAFHRSLTTPEELRRLVARSGAHPGAAVITQLLDGGPQLSDAGAGQLLLALIRRAGLPRPVTELPVLQGRYRADFAWPDARLIVEADGLDWHGPRTAAARDHRRDAELAAAGWLTLRFTYRQVVTEPAWVAATIAAALAERRALLAAA